jgi:antitoxin ParD1/3/4
MKSEDLRELVRQDEQHKAGAQLESLLLQSLESGKSTPMTKGDWDNIRKEVRRRADRREKGKSETYQRSLTK